MSTVRYTGRADERVIDEAAWRNAGVDEQPRVSWNHGNGYTVGSSELTQAAVEWAKSQPEFTVDEDERQQTRPAEQTAEQGAEQTAEQQPESGGQQRRRR